MNALIKSAVVTAMSVTFALPLVLVVEGFVFSTSAHAQQQDAKPKRKTKRVESIRAANVKAFEKINEAFDQEKISEAKSLLDKLSAKGDLNNIETAYVANFRGNIYFTQDNLGGALREFKKILAIKEGIPEAFYNQIIYTVAQVYFSQEKYGEALKYAQQWFRVQQDPPADAYMLIGQAQYMLKRYDDALPNVQKGIDKYKALGSVPKESWLNLLSNIYRQKSNYKKMLPVIKQLVQHYPKKMYLMSMAGVYNELNQPSNMTAIYQAMYDQGLVKSESEIVTLASLLLSQDSPYKASRVLEKGINDGVIKRNLKNYRLFSQSLYMAKEYEKSIKPLEQAAKLSGDGKLYNQLGQSLIALGRYNEADRALRNAINKKGLANAGNAWISLGMVRFEQKQFEGAKKAFRNALGYEKTASAAKQWMKYVDSEVFRIKELKKEIVINTDIDV